MTTHTIQDAVVRLIEEGRGVLSTEFDAGSPEVHYSGGRPRGVKIEPFAKWRAGCANLVRLLGIAADAWKNDFDEIINSHSNAERMIGTLGAIADALKYGLLTSVEDIVRAEAFDSLLSQADYLLSEGYFLAAGVLGRAVLEEHLRKWCDLKSCAPAKPKPTLNDFKDCLYKAKEINVTQMKHLESLGAVGNDAAHNVPSLKVSDVERLLRDVRDVLLRHPLSSV
jgi:hypothetical protein